MKNLIWFIVLVFIAWEVSKLPIFKDWVNELEQTVITKAEDTVGKSSLNKITTELSLLKDTLSPAEVSYLIGNISTMVEAENFKTTYCDSKSKLRHNVLTNHAFEQACIVLNKHLIE